MNRPVQWCMATTLAGLILVGGAGCSSESRRDKHFQRGDEYFQQGKYREALIEYMNVLQIEPTNSAAIRQMGLSCYEAGDIRRAAALLVKAAELDPDNPEVQRKLAALYLWGGDAARAREIALSLLEKNADDFDALILLADASVTPDQLTDTAERLDEVKAKYGERALYHVARGNVMLRQRNMDGAEMEYNAAQALDPKATEVHQALAFFYKVQGRSEEADREYGIAAELAPPGSLAWIKWADFKVHNGKPDEGEAILRKVVEAAPENLAARYRLAELDFLHRRYAECQDAVARILKEEPSYHDALLLQNRVRLAMGQTQKAVEGAEAMVALFPNSPQVRYELALAAIANRDIRKATDTLQQTLQQQPDQTNAVFLLSELQIRTGNPDAAIQLLVDFMQKHAGLARGYVLLGTAYRAAERPADALAVYRKLAELAPKSPQPPYLVGLVQRGEGKAAEARKSFEQALALAPTFLYALTQLVALDIEEKDYAAAAARIEGQIRATEDTSSMRTLLGQVFVARGDTKGAAVEFNKAIALAPENLGPYLSLVQLYVAEGREQEALDQLNEALAVKPDNIPSLMLAGVLYQQKDDVENAQKNYERILKLNPRFAQAANNLAYLYSEKLNNLDKAYEIASAARDQAPQDPYIADTLGWIVYKRGDFKWALSLLQESADQLPREPEVFYHLGMTQYALGNEAATREALKKSLSMEKPLVNSNDAARLVQVLELGTSPTDASSADTLRAVLAGDPKNVSALTQLATLQAQGGDKEEARALYEKAMAANPNFVPAITGLAELLLQTPGGAGKALPLAKKARELAPRDAQVISTLGWAAYQGGDTKWAASLLHEAVRIKPDDSEILFRSGMATYLSGDANAARAEVERAMALSDEFPNVRAARLFLALTGTPGTPGSAEAVESAGDALKTDSRYVPALMVLAEQSEKTGQTAEAVKTYRSIIAAHPDFSPAIRNLLLATADDAADQEATFNLAVKARNLMPDDAAVGLALAKIVYRRGQYDWSKRLLAETATKLSGDAEVQYYLGMCSIKLNDPDAARSALTKALELDPNMARADEVRQTLSELP